jgi:hypothetical protein
MVRVVLKMQSLGLAGGGVRFAPDVAEALVRAGWRRAEDAAVLLPPPGEPARAHPEVEAEIPDGEEALDMAVRLDREQTGMHQASLLGWPATYVRGLLIYRHSAPFSFWVGTPRCPFRARTRWRQGRALGWRLGAGGIVSGAEAWRATFREPVPWQELQRR